MMMLKDLQEKLTRLRQRVAAQERVVREIEEPRRQLEALQAEERELAEQAAAIEERRSSANAEIERIDAYLSRWAPRRARLKAAMDIIRDVEETEQLHDFYGLTAGQMNTVWRGIALMLERLDHQQNKRAELLQQLKELE